MLSIIMLICYELVCLITGLHAQYLNSKRNAVAINKEISYTYNTKKGRNHEYDRGK